VVLVIAVSLRSGGMMLFAMETMQAHVGGPYETLPVHVKSQLVR
jgi:hypothetical protein